MKRQYELIIIGGSAGSLEVLLRVLPMLRADLAVPVLIVLHRKYSNDSILVDLLAPKTALKVTEAEEKEVLLPGTIYFAPPDYHLLIEKDHSISLDFSEKINFSRPSIDVSFETAAEVYGSGVIAVLLSGANADGVEGLKLIKKNGGTIVVQHPDTAEVAYMPEHAIDQVSVDYILSPDQIALFLNTEGRNA